MRKEMCKKGNKDVNTRGELRGNWKKNTRCKDTETDRKKTERGKRCIDKKDEGN
jgi:hypothetical protein